MSLIVLQLSRNLLLVFPFFLWSCYCLYYRFFFRRILLCFCIIDHLFLYSIKRTYHLYYSMDFIPTSQQPYMVGNLYVSSLIDQQINIHIFHHISAYLNYENWKLKTLIYPNWESYNFSEISIVQSFFLRSQKCINLYRI